MKSTKVNRKPKTKQYTNQNILETFRGIIGGVAQQGQDLGKKLVTPVGWDEILGFKDDPEKQNGRFHGDLSEGQELNLKDLAQKEEQKNAVYIEPGIDYSKEIVHVGEQLVTKVNREIDRELREIMLEIKKLADSTKELQAQFKDVAVEQYVVTPGKYHKSFFEWLLSVVRAARMRVEDSNSWLAAMHSKKKSRQYGAMSKKHGTTFSLSNERVVATQVG